MKNYTKNISTFLKDTRTLLMYKQKEVSDAVNISVQSYIKYEKGLRDPSVEVLYKIASFYKVSPILFFLSDYPLSNEDYNNNAFMILSIIAANLERYRWLLKRYEEKALIYDIPNWDGEYINNDNKTLLKIKADLFRISGDIKTIKNDLTIESDNIEEETNKLINKISKL